MGHNAVIVEIPDHGQIEDALTSLDVRDICHPLGIGLVRVKLPVKQVFILVDLLSHLPPSPRSADLRQHLILLHDPQHSFGIAVDALTLQPKLHPPVTIGLPDAGLLLLKKLPQLRIRFWPTQTVDKIIVSAPGYPEELAHDRYGIIILCSLFSYTEGLLSIVRFYWSGPNRPAGDSLSY